jgi:hypothetical protein
MLGGVLLIGLGAFIVLYAMSHYQMGTLRRMGPGMFPAMVGGLMSVFGVILLVSGFLREGELPKVRIWSPLFVLAGVATFALLIEPFGLVPAVIGTVLVSSLAERRLQPVAIPLLAGGLCVLVWLIFRVGLGLPIPMFDWPE